ncbi:hypothetical protein P171DRAFT_488933 [Karstenula rhodostoma CBS 690.94]|uniref:Uncharacterized protein n=1 Tax=Karstenula rhodostoma CBS 690.94 TaxID=1392251 RepID=A0A9P4U8N0_9PLEO|nr:hypothetical protein P171DRAFT_488933 [Karstenula rhodostoma CBS 690.94]
MACRTAVLSLPSVARLASSQKAARRLRTPVHGHGGTGRAATRAQQQQSASLRQEEPRPQRAASGTTRKACSGLEARRRAAIRPSAMRRGLALITRGGTQAACTGEKNRRRPGTVGRPRPPSPPQSLSGVESQRRTSRAEAEQPLEKPAVTKYIGTTVRS